ncbi:MAG: hypothetical protein BRD52_05015 [Bacteroidetes bacterium SW_4_67_19]|jgi:hypothetical protein|nr:MAG: hypothetical protein BRD52_05015 [Bacteroidetes bacterium SW_4_67_19]
MNVRLLQRVRDAIADRPDRYCAAHWAFARNRRAVIEFGARPDHFRCCIAGHVLLEEKGGDYDEKGLLCEGGFHDPGHLWQRAAEAAGLTEAQRNELFFPSQWDAPFKKGYYLSSGAEEAEISAAYIDHFLDKHAPERTWAADRPAVPGGEEERREAEGDVAARVA